MPSRIVRKPKTCDVIFEASCGDLDLSDATVQSLVFAIETYAAPVFIDQTVRPEQTVEPGVRVIKFQTQVEPFSVVLAQVYEEQNPDDLYHIWGASGVCFKFKIFWNSQKGKPFAKVSKVLTL